MNHDIQRSLYEGETFSEILNDQIRRTPWFVISAAVHAVLFALLSAFIADDPAIVEIDTAEMALEAPVEELEDIVDPTPPDEVEPTPTPVPVNTEFPTEVPQEESEDEFAEYEGESEDALSTKLDATNLNDTIGLGGSACGDFGDRGGRRPGGSNGPPSSTEVIVERGLEWLARHQSRDGSWDGDGFTSDEHGAGCACQSGSRGSAVHDVGLTGLALLCFLGAGETHKRGDYKDTVKRALRWLRSRQDSEGCFASRTTPSFTYDHAIATLAMTEAYGMTRSPLFKRCAQEALTFVHQIQNYGAAWRYGEADGDNDVSVTGWMVMALKAGRAAGLTVEERHMDWALAYVESMTDQETGRTGYISRGEPPVREKGKQAAFPSSETESLTAVAIISRIFCGQDPDTTPMIRHGVENVLTKKLPVWDTARGSIDMYYWYYGSLAMYQVGGAAWRKWNRAMVGAVVESQRSDGDFSGSWDPVGAWGDVGGRVYSTALMTLCLEVYYRYGRVFGVK